MGAEGSGRYTIISKAWDIVDHCWTVLNALERNQYDSSKAINTEFIEQARAQLRSLQDQLKAAIERERTK